MKAVLCKEYGSPETLVIEEVANPEAGPGEVVIDVHSAALNFPDTLQINGKYQFQPPMPFTPGSETAGVIRAVGEGVTNVQVGDRVMAANFIGGMAEQVKTMAVAVRKLPKSMSMNVGCGFNMIYGTSYYALKQRGKLQAGETLLVLGASGGVGLAAVELGKAMGARVIAAASTDEKLAYAKAAGADELINYSTDDLKERVKALTNKQGADVIYDPVGGELFQTATRCVAWDGRILVVGFASGEIPAFKTNLALLKSSSIVGVFWGNWVMKDPAANEQNFVELFDYFAEGKLKPLVTQVYPFEQVSDDLNLFINRKAVGKVVLQLQS